MHGFPSGEHPQIVVFWQEASALDRFITSAASHFTSTARGRVTCSIGDLGRDQHATS